MVNSRDGWDVFVSYSRRDKDFVRQLTERLHNRDQTPWIDWNDIPLLSEWRQEIRQGILSSNNFLFILSPDSLASDECAKELECAIASNKRLVPIVCRRVDGCTVPHALAEINWIFFDNPENFESSFQNLVQALETDLDYLKVHTRLLTRADEWHSQQRDDSFLLHGTNLETVEAWVAEKSEYTPPLTQLQRDYIANSRIAETKRQKREKHNQRIVLGSVISALLIAIGLGLVTEGRRRIAITRNIEALNSASTASLALGKPLEGMLQALRANRQLQKAGWISQPLRIETLSVLRQMAYDIQERNRLEAHDMTIDSVAFSPDGRGLVSGSLDGTIKLWTLDGSLTKSWSTSEGGKIVDVSFSPDGQFIASGGENTSVQIWDLEGQLINTLEPQGDNYDVEFSPDGQTLATASLDNYARIWGLDGQLKYQPIEHSSDVLSVDFNSINSSLLSSSFDGTLTIFKTDGTLTRISDQDVRDARFSPDGTLIAAVGESGTVNLWQPDGTWLKQLQGSTAPLWTTDINPDGQLIAAAGEDQKIYLWRSDGTLVTRMPGHQGIIRHVAFNPTENLLASASDDLSIRLWQWQNPWKRQLFGHDSAVNSMAVNPKTQTIVSGAEDGSLKIWSATGELLQDLPTSLPSIEAVSISPDGQWMVAGAYDVENAEQGLLHLWTAAGEYQRLLGRQGAWVSAVAFSPDSQIVASASDDGQIQLRTLSGEVQQRFQHDGAVYSIAFSPDGRLLAAAGEGAINLWNLETATLTHTYQTSGNIYSLSFSPDGNTLAFGSSDRTVSLWPLNQSEPRPLEQKHDGEVYAVRFSPDGRWIASAGEDNAARLWTAEGEVMATLGRHNGGIDTLAFTADSTQLITGSSDKTLIIWDLSILEAETLIAWSCDWLANYLRTNPNVSSEDRQLCQGVKPWMPR